MEKILSPFAATVSELKKNPTALLKEADNSPVAILNHNRVTAYLVPVEVYETMIDIIEDYELGQLVQEREDQKKMAFAVDIDEL